MNDNFKPEQRVWVLHQLPKSRRPDNRIPGIVKRDDGPRVAVWVWVEQHQQMLVMNVIRERVQPREAERFQTEQPFEVDTRHRRELFGAVS